MTPHQRLITALMLVPLVVIVLVLVRRQKLGVSMGVLWSGLLLGALLILAVPGLLERITALTGAVFPVSAITLLALLVIALFLFYFSLVVQRLGRKHVELVRTLALMEHRLRERGSAPGNPATEPGKRALDDHGRSA